MGAVVWRITTFCVGLFMLTDAASEEAYQTFGCLIEPYAVIDLSTREEGIIDKILVKRGDHVHPEQVVATLEADVEQASVELARARTQMDAELEERRADVALAKRELLRIDKLFETNSVSFTEKDRATTEATRARLRLRQTEHRQALAQLELERARKVLQRRTLVSPVAGIVVERLLSPGESVENSTILKIAEVDPLNVEVIMPISQFGSIEVNRLAEIEPLYPAAQMHDAKVSVVDRVVDSASDTFGVRLEMPNPKYLVPAGVRCKIRFLPIIPSQ